MINKQSNPFLDAPLTIGKITLMGISMIVFIGSVIYGTIRGAFWYIRGKNRERRLDDFHVIMHKIFKFHLRSHPWLFCDIQNTYKETFERGAIAICNHQSLIDTLCLLILSPKILIVTGKRVWNNPIIKSVLYFAEFTCVNRPIDELLEYSRFHIKRGYTIIIFPEGERSLHGHILRFHSGAFYLAKELKTDILPLYIHGTGHVLPLHKAFQNRARLYVEIGKRIPYNLIADTDTRKLANDIRSQYQLHYEKLCRELENAEYYSYLVINLFKRGGKSRYASALLKQYHNFSEWIDQPFVANQYLIIEDHTNGIFTLLFALVHPYTNIYSLNTGSLKKLLEKCHNLPQNIHFITNRDFTDTDISADLLFAVNNIVKVFNS